MDRLTPYYNAAQAALVWRVQHQQDSQAMTELLQQCEPLIATVIRYYVTEATDRATLMHIGRVGVFRAARSFDPSRGILFKTYAGTRIRGEVLHYFGRDSFRRKRRLTPVITSYDADQEDGPSLEIPYYDPGYAAVEEAVTVQALLRPLSRIAQTVVLQHGVHGESQKAVARRLRLTPSQVSKIYISALSRLRRTLNGKVATQNGTHGG